MTYRKPFLIGSTLLLLGSAMAFGQGVPTLGNGVAYDPAQLPAYKGQVQTFTLTPRGDIDGFVLADGTEVKTPPHLSTQIAFAIKPGDNVTVHGLKAATLPLIQGVSIADDASGKLVVDTGPVGPGREPPPPPGDAPPPPPSVAGPAPNGPSAGAPAQSGQAAAGQAEIQGMVRMALHGARGEVNGALLDDGTILRLPPPEALRFAALLQAGQALAASGDAIQSPIAKVVDVTSIGASRDAMSPVRQPPKPGPRGPRPPV